MYYQQNNERQKRGRKEVNENSAFSASRDIQLKCRDHDSNTGRNAIGERGREVHLLLEQRVKDPSLFKMICFHSLLKHRAVEPARLAAFSAASRERLKRNAIRPAGLVSRSSFFLYFFLSFFLFIILAVFSLLLHFLPFTSSFIN